MANLLLEKLNVFMNNKNSDFESNIQVLTDIYNNNFIDKTQFANIDIMLLNATNDLFTLDYDDSHSFKFNNLFDYYYFCLDRKLKNYFPLNHLYFNTIAKNVFLDLLSEHKILSYIEPDEYWASFRDIYHRCNSDELIVFDKLLKSLNGIIKEWYIPNWMLDKKLDFVRDFIEEGSFILTRNQYENLKTSLSGKKQNELDVYLQLSGSNDEFVYLQRENRYKKDFEINDQISLI